MLIKKKKGFTLVEMAITIIIVSIMAMILFSITSQGFRIWKAGKEKAEIRSSANFFLEKITPEVMESSIAGAPFSGATQVTYYYDLNSDGIQDSHRYYLSADKILLSITSGAAITIATQVSALTFSAATYTSPTYYTDLNIDVYFQKGGSLGHYRTRIVPRSSLE